MKNVNIVFNNHKLNKSPGRDGIPNEFYQAFWPTIQNFMVEVFNEIYEKFSSEVGQDLLY